MLLSFCSGIQLFTNILLVNCIGQKDTDVALKSLIIKGPQLNEASPRDYKFTDQPLAGNGSARNLLSDYRVTSRNSNSIIERFLLLPSSRDFMRKRAGVVWWENSRFAESFQKSNLTLLIFDFLCAFACICENFVFFLNYLNILTPLFEKYLSMNYKLLCFATEKQ